MRINYSQKDYMMYTDYFADITLDDGTHLRVAYAPIEETTIPESIQLCNADTGAEIESFEGSDCEHPKPLIELARVKRSPYYNIYKQVVEHTQAIMND